MDAEDLIKKYIEYRDFINEEEALLKGRLAPYKQALKTIEGGFALLAEKTGQSAIKTASGTAFPVEKLYVKCEDREMFIDFVFATGAKEFLTAHVSKDAVRDYMEKMEGQQPPGILTEKAIEWQVRRA